MAEIQPRILVVAGDDALESTELLFPVPINVVSGPTALIKKIITSTNGPAADLQRYFILCLESIGNEEDEMYQQIEENPKVIAVFHICNESTVSTTTLTKVYHIQRELITSAVTYSIIELFKNEAEREKTLRQVSLSKIYLRKAEKIKEWLMSTIRAEPSDILVIPLNTDSANVADTIQQLTRCCESVGYPSAVIRSLDAYLPTGEIYDKLPYGKMIFENESPLVICRWLRELSPVRMYLYGNEQVISSEWSKQMIATEIDHVSKNIVNDDDWYMFLENEPIDDEIKWNFHARHGQKWKVTRYAPIKLTRLSEHLRFRPALRRARMTFHARRSTTTAQIYEWFDQCLHYGYIRSEFQSRTYDSHKPPSIFKDTEQLLSFASEFSSAYEKSNSPDDLPAQLYEVSKDNDTKSVRVYVWLDTDFRLLEERFQTAIDPDRWNCFADIDECQTFILNQQMHSGPQIHLLARSSLAEQLFTYKHVPFIDRAYLYSNQETISTQWATSFPAIRGIHSDFDSLYEQFLADLRRNIEPVQTRSQLQEHEGLPPTSFLTLDGDRFLRYRALMSTVLNSSRTLNTKQEMFDELHRRAEENEISPEKIDQFEQNYQSNDAIRWYTRESFIYRLINQALRSDDFGLIWKYRSFIVDLHEALADLYRQTTHSNDNSKQAMIHCYRGCVLHPSQLDQYKQNIGNLVLTNGFLSTSLSLDIAVSFSGTALLEADTSLQSVLFSIKVDTSVTNTQPYASVNSLSNYEHEEEVLFMAGTVFRIEKVETASLTSDFEVIHLELIDESELPDTSINIADLLPGQQTLDPIYALVGLTSLFQGDGQRERVKAILETLDVRFFDRVEDLEHLTKSIGTVQPFVVFVHTQSHVPAQYQQTRLISFAENDTHFNDLVYQLLYEMEHNTTLEKRLQNAYANLADVYCPADTDTFYVQLLLSSAWRKEAEEQFIARFPSTSVIACYQTDPCTHFLQSIVEPSKIGEAILILQSDAADLDELITRFEQIDSVRKIYLCSKDPSLVEPRRILHGKFATEHDLYTQLYSDHVLQSFVQTNQQIDVYKNKREAIRCFELTERFQKLLREHVDQEKTKSNIIENTVAENDQ